MDCLLHQDVTAEPLAASLLQHLVRIPASCQSWEPCSPGPSCSRVKHRVRIESLCVTHRPFKSCRYILSSSCSRRSTSHLPASPLSAERGLSKSPHPKVPKPDHMASFIRSLRMQSSTCSISQLGAPVTFRPHLRDSRFTGSRQLCLPCRLAPQNRGANPPSGVPAPGTGLHPSNCAV